MISSHDDCTREQKNEPAPWSAVAIRLLQGVIYHDDSAENWDTLLRSISPLQDFFTKLGVELIIAEADGMAYLRQPDDEELPASFDSLPKLFRKSALSYDATLLCVLLRDLMRQYEEEDFQNERCVIAQNDLYELWQSFFPTNADAVKLNRSLHANLRKLEELKFVRQFESDPPSWEIRRILKAKLPLETLAQLRDSLTNACGESDSAQEAKDETLPNGTSMEASS